MLAPDWRCVALQKTNATMAKIPPAWVLSDDTRAEAASRRDITGDFISSLLSNREQIITGWGSADLVEHVRQRRCSATDVALAYCKRAAFAHQLVRIQPWPWPLCR